jgi:hypothetical protein
LIVSLAGSGERSAEMTGKPEDFLAFRTTNGKALIQPVFHCGASSGKPCFENAFYFPGKVVRPTGSVLIYRIDHSHFTTVRSINNIFGIIFVGT